MTAPSIENNQMSYNNRRACKVLEGIREITPAPGAGIWDDEPLRLPDVWAYKLFPSRRMTIAEAVDWRVGTKQLYPYERLARYLIDHGHDPQEAADWASGKGAVGLMTARFSGKEYRDCDGLIFERALA